MSIVLLPTYACTDEAITKAVDKLRFCIKLKPTLYVSSIFSNIDSYFDVHENLCKPYFHLYIFTALLTIELNKKPRRKFI